MLGEVVTVTAVDDVFLVVLIDSHQGAFFTGNAGDDGTALLVTTVFTRAANSPLEGQSFVTLFQHHVDDAADGVGTIDG